MRVHSGPLFRSGRSTGQWICTNGYTHSVYATSTWSMYEGQTQCVGLVFSWNWVADNNGMWRKTKKKVLLQLIQLQTFFFVLCACLCELPLIRIQYELRAIQTDKTKKLIFLWCWHFDTTYKTHTITSWETQDVIRIYCSNLHHP